MFYHADIVGRPRREFIRILSEIKRIQIVNRFLPLHVRPESALQGHRCGDCPVAERVFFEEQVNLPINPRMTAEDCTYVIDAVAHAVRILKERPATQGPARGAQPQEATA
jgi:dTDP-4-amino-4,6-dideoxygalactose transaminase